MAKIYQYPPRGSTRRRPGDEDRPLTRNELLAERRKTVTKYSSSKQRERDWRAKREESEIEVSRFKEEWGKFKKRVGADNQNFEPHSASTAMLRSILAMLLEMLPLVEKTFLAHPTERSVSSIVGLSRECRDVSNELRALADRNQLPVRILREVIEPILAELIQSIQVDNAQLKRTINREVNSGAARRQLHRRADDLFLNMVSHVRKVRAQSEETVQRVLD